MPNVDLDELGRLAEIYRDSGTTNPVVALRLASLSPTDKGLLRFIIGNSDRERREAWNKEAGTGASSDGVRPLSKEEYENVARRDFSKVDRSALLRFRAQLGDLKRK